MAKGLEDTAFYRYYPLASLNEVGGDPSSPGVSVEQFHRVMPTGAEQWPDSLSATSTHDTKRGEDVRARLNVLSEMPEEWEDADPPLATLERTACEARLDGEPVPDANEEYLLYQTLVGTWPLAPGETALPPDYVERIARLHGQGPQRSQAAHELGLSERGLRPDRGQVRRGGARPAQRRRVFWKTSAAFVGSVADAGFTNVLRRRC